MGDETVVDLFPGDTNTNLMRETLADILAKSCEDSETENSSFSADMFLSSHTCVVQLASTD